MIEIQFVNASSVVKQEDFSACIAALQLQVSRDLFVVYGIDAVLSIAPSPKSWQLIVGDNSDQLDALGYHELTASGQPLGKVFAKTTQDDGGNWTVTASHELLEMLLDPWVCLCAQDSDNAIRAYEICDAVEDDQFGYKINGILVSDFVLPSWFDGSAAPFDFGVHVTNALELLAGGYISILGKKGWQQVQAEKKGNARQDIQIGSRRLKRVIGRKEWRVSTL